MKKRNCLVIIAVAALLSILFAGCAIAALELSSQAFGRIEESYAYMYLPFAAVYPREEIRFDSGGKRLQGFIYGGSNTAGLIIVSPGLGCTADYYFPIIRYFVDTGWRVFAFNNTGVAGSEGESMRGLTQAVIDLDAALRYVESSGRFDSLPVMLAGHSLGGFAVCAALTYNHPVNAVVSFSGFNNSSDVLKEQGMLLIGAAYYLISPQLWAIEKQLFGNMAKLTAVDGINRAGIPVMIVHSSNDAIIPAATTALYARRDEIESVHNVDTLWTDYLKKGIFAAFRRENARSVHKVTDFVDRLEITNPLVEIVFKDGEAAAGHWPYQGADNELDSALMKQINQFFTNAK